MGAELPDYQSYFNSRPHGGRQARPIFFDASRDFNSRPHGGRLSCHAIDIVTFNISTHALPEGDALLTAGSRSRRLRFQLTPSRRATHAFSQRFSSKSISTHALTEGDDSAGIRRSSWYISTHALTEGDVFSSVKSMHAFNFNSRPHGGRLPVAV